MKHNRLHVCFLFLISSLLSACLAGEDLDAIGQVGEFVQAIDTNRSSVAWALLASSTQGQITEAQLAQAGDNFALVAQAFRQANITIRSEQEIAHYVPNWNGQEEAVRFVLVREGAQWRIANLLLEPPP